MTISETTLRGVFTVEPDVMRDDRGFFATLYTPEGLASVGIDAQVAQHAIAFNEHKATIRGLHYQAPPYEETKIVRCTAGTIFDVVADIRPDSPTWGRWIGVELSAANRTSILIPPGCAHGYLTLTRNTEITYLISAPYVESAQRGVRWDDALLEIAWPETPKTIGARDAMLPVLDIRTRR